jgi:ketol-acid reductoisomerase
MDAIRDADIDPDPLLGKRVAILGYGNQGRAQALNLKDSGIDVVVGFATVHRAMAGRMRRNSTRDRCIGAASSADIVMLLAPDEALAAIYRESNRISLRAPHSASATDSPSASASSSRADLDVFMVAPKGRERRCVPFT